MTVLWLDPNHTAKTRSVERRVPERKKRSTHRYDVFVVHGCRGVRFNIGIIQLLNHGRLGNQNPGIPIELGVPLRLDL
jgi:hypothetical protein